MDNTITNFCEINDAIVDLYENKQDKLISGETLKTINYESLLGRGNIDIIGGQGSSLLLGHVNQDSSSLPTTRMDNTPAEKEDYVKPESDADFPFTIDGVTFNTRLDRAIYLGDGRWMIDSGVILLTNETPVSDENLESIEENATFQSDINKLFTDIIGKNETINVEDEETLIGSVNYIWEEVSKLGGRVLKFRGFISNTAPTGNIADNSLWFHSSTLPTTFPISVKTYDAETSTWSSTNILYNPTTFDLWANLNDNNGFYWFGNGWNIIDENVLVDDKTIHKNLLKELELKDGDNINGVTFNKLNYNLYTNRVINNDESFPINSAVYKELLNKNQSKFEYDDSNRLKDLLTIVLKNNNGDTILNKEIDFRDKLVFEKKELTLENKTIDADDNEILDLTGENVKDDFMVHNIKASDFYYGFTRNENNLFTKVIQDGIVEVYSISDEKVITNLGEGTLSGTTLTYNFDIYGRNDSIDDYYISLSDIKFSSVDMAIFLKKLIDKQKIYYKRISTFVGETGNTDTLYYLDTNYSTRVKGFYCYVENTVGGVTTGEFILIGHNQIVYVSTFTGLTGNEEKLYYLDTDYDGYVKGFYRYIDSPTNRFVLIGHNQLVYVSSFTNVTGNEEKLYYLDTDTETHFKGFYRYNASTNKFIPINETGIIYTSTFTGITGKPDFLYFLDTAYDDYKIGFYRYVEKEEAETVSKEFILIGSASEVFTDVEELPQEDISDLTIYRLKQYKYLYNNTEITEPQGYRSTGDTCDISSGYIIINESDSYEWENVTDDILSTLIELNYIEEVSTFEDAEMFKINSNEYVYWSLVGKQPYYELYHNPLKNPLKYILIDDERVKKLTTPGLHAYVHDGTSQYEMPIVTEVGDNDLTSHEVHASDDNLATELAVRKAIDEIQVIIDAEVLPVEDIITESFYRVNEYYYDNLNRNSESIIGYKILDTSKVISTVEGLTVVPGDLIPWDNVTDDIITGLGINVAVSTDEEYDFVKLDDDVYSDKDNITKVEEGLYHNPTGTPNNWVKVGSDSVEPEAIIDVDILPEDDIDIHSIYRINNYYCNYSGENYNEPQIFKSIDDTIIATLTDLIVNTSIYSWNSVTDTLISELLNNSLIESAPSFLDADFVKLDNDIYDYIENVNIIKQGLYHNPTGLSNGWIIINEDKEINLDEITTEEVDNKIQANAIIPVNALPTTNIKDKSFYELTETLYLLDHNYMYNGVHIEILISYVILNSFIVKVDADGISYYDGTDFLLTYWNEVTDSFIQTMIDDGFIEVGEFNEAAFCNGNGVFDIASNFSDESSPETFEMTKLFRSKNGTFKSVSVVKLPEKFYNLLTAEQRNDGTIYIIDDLIPDAIIDVEELPISDISNKILYRLTIYKCALNSTEEIIENAVGYRTKNLDVCSYDSNAISISPEGEEPLSYTWEDVSDSLITDLIDNDYIESVPLSEGDFFKIDNDTYTYETNVTIISSYELYHNPTSTENEFIKIGGEDSNIDDITIVKAFDSLRANAIIDVNTLPSSDILKNSIYRKLNEIYYYDGVEIQEHTGYISTDDTVLEVTVDGLIHNYDDGGTTASNEYSWDDVNDSIIGLLTSADLISTASSYDEAQFFSVGEEKYDHKSKVTKEEIYELYHNPTGTLDGFKLINGGNSSEVDEVTTQIVDNKIQANAVIQVVDLPTTDIKDKSFYLCIENTNYIVNHYIKDEVEVTNLTFLRENDPSVIQVTYNGIYYNPGDSDWTYNSLVEFSDVTQNYIDALFERDLIVETDELTATFCKYAPNKWDWLNDGSHTGGITHTSETKTFSMTKLFKRENDVWRSLSVVGLTEKLYNSLPLSSKTDGTVYIIDDNAEFAIEMTYNSLSNKPSVNGITLNGALTLEDLGLYSRREVNALLENKGQLEFVDQLPATPTANTWYYSKKFEDGTDVDDNKRVLYIVDEDTTVYNDMGVVGDIDMETGDTLSGDEHIVTSSLVVKKELTKKLDKYGTQVNVRGEVDDITLWNTLALIDSNDKKSDTDDLFNAGTCFIEYKTSPTTYNEIYQFIVTGGVSSGSLSKKITLILPKTCEIFTKTMEDGVWLPWKKSPNSSEVENKIDTAGAGLLKTGTTLGHSNSITAQTSLRFYCGTLDAQGHYSSATAFLYSNVYNSSLDNCLFTRNGAKNLYDFVKITDVSGGNAVTTTGLDSSLSRTSGSHQSTVSRVMKSCGVVSLQYFGQYKSTAAISGKFTCIGSVPDAYKPVSQVAITVTTWNCTPLGSASGYVTSDGKIYVWVSSISNGMTNILFIINSSWKAAS